MVLIPHPEVPPDRRRVFAPLAVAGIAAGTWLGPRGAATRAAAAAYRPAALLAAILAAACIPRAPVVRLTVPTPVGVAYVLDHDDRLEAAEVPEGLRERVDTVLAERNLVPQQLGPGEYLEDFASTRDTTMRVGRLLALGTTPIVVLVETKALYFSQLNGRYRWTVHARITVVEREQPTAPLTTDFDFPSVLDFEHQREAEAVAAVAGLVAERTGTLIDRFLGGRPQLRQERVEPGAAGVEAAQAPAETVVVHDEQSHPLPKDGRSRPPRERSFDAIYFVLVDRFANGDPTNDAGADPSDPAAWHGGDLQGVLDHLDHLQALGVRTVWLSPVSLGRQTPFMGLGAFHGYWVEELGTMEPRFGDLGLLRQLGDELRRRDMRLVLDVVLNHVDYDARLVAERPQWFHDTGVIEDWSDPRQLVEHRVHGLPDLAQEDEEVYAHLLAASKRWIDAARPHGFRLDAVKHVPLAFWRRYNADILAHAGPGFTLLGEVFEGSPAALASYLREGGFTHVFDFPLHYALEEVFCDGGPVGKLAATLFADRCYDDPTRLVPFLDNHDLPRVLSACNGDAQRVERALTLMLALRGTPSLTYGTEAGLTGDEEPHNRGDMRFDAADSPLARRIAALLRLRREHPALTSGHTRVVELDRDLLVLLRLDAREAVVVAVNTGEAATEVPGLVFARANAPASAAAPHHAVATDLLSGRSLASGLRLAPGEVLLARLDLPPAELARLLEPPPARAVKVRVRGVPDGAEAFIVGGAPELGSWDPHAGHGPLARHGSEHLASLSFPVGAVLEYKLVAREGDRVIWEQRQNRYLFVRPGHGPLGVALAWEEDGGRG